MPTRAPIEGATPWLQRTRIAKTRGYFTDREKSLAGEWTTCPVGEQHALWPLVVLFDRTGVPVDAELRRLGGGIHTKGFYYAVAEDQPELARQRCIEIRERVHEMREARARDVIA